MEHLLKGIVIGFAIAAPIGPINLLCLRRSLSDGRRVGFVSGLGAAAADTTYGTIAAAGLTTVTAFLVGRRFWLQSLGGVFLGSSLWWLLLALLAGTFGRHLNDGTLRWVNRFAGGVIAGFGMWQLWQLVSEWLR